MSDTPAIPPALTPEEWGARRYHRDGPTKREWEFASISDDGKQVFVGGEHDFGAVAMPQSRHALAALCLHEQPFGFTHEDVDLCRTIAEDYEYRGLEPSPFDQLRDLAARIAALLPPTP